MHLFHVKDDFGMKRLYLMRPISYLFAVAAFIILVCVACQRPKKTYRRYEPLLDSIPKVDMDIEFVEEVKSNSEITYNDVSSPIVKSKYKKEDRTKMFVKTDYRLEYRFSVMRYVTCYTGYEPGDPCDGIYANQNFADKLHKDERNIVYDHNTVALCPEDKEYHKELILMPSGKWEHKWRVHIDGVHKDKVGDSTEKGFFAVPRDRMKQSKRIDYLITQAGKYNNKQERVKNWKSLNRNCDFYEWTAYNLYSDGSTKKVN